jgi:hypothetical protein
VSDPLADVRAAVAAAVRAQADVRASIIAAVASGVRVPEVAAAAGLTRGRVYQILQAARPVPTPDEEVMLARLAELDERWEALVDLLAPRPDDRRYNCGYAAETRFRNVANGKARKRGRPPVYQDVKPLIRDLAEAELLLVLEHRGDELVVRALGDFDRDATIRDLDEAAALRKDLAAFGDAGGFFAGV